MSSADTNDSRALNPAMLKLRLALEGLDCAAPAEDAVELILPDDVAARARVNRASALSYLERGDDSAIAIDGVEHPARMVPEPEFSRRNNARGVALGSIVRVRGLYAVVALGGGCSGGAIEKTCAMCLGRELTAPAGEWWPAGEVVDAVRAAFDEGAAEFVRFNLGYVPGDDAGVERLRPYIEAMQHHFDATICVAMHPPAALSAIDRTYAMGVDVISYDLEAPDRATMEKYFPGRARFFGRERYLKALAHAAKVFPRGAVWSELRANMAPAQSVVAAIHELTATGVMPLLSAWSEGAASAQELAPVCSALFDAATNAGLNLSWASGLSTALTPLEARYFVAGASAPPLIHQLRRNPLGALATRSLARMRRRLRVRRVRASFDSSHL
jgi:hypothetical protein